MVDLSTRVGSVGLRSAVMTASGTAGHGAELGAYGPLRSLGAVVVKSLAAFDWPGNPPPRLLPGTSGAMLNRVGLQGPGVEAWREHDLPDLTASGAAVVGSIWGRSVADYEKAASALAGAPGVVAVEVNVSCPNVEDRARMFAHSAAATADAVAAAAAAGLPRWAKLSPNVADLCEIAGAALDAGAEALTLVNTLLGAAVEVDDYGPGPGPGRGSGRGSGSGSGSGSNHGCRQGPDDGQELFEGGLSGPALRPVAVRAIADCRAAFPGAGIVGVGGVGSGRDALELLMAGADAVQVGTATFADPRAPWKVQEQLGRWCRRHRVGIREVVGAALPPREGR